MTGTPPVSCIMPTADRREFVRESLAQYCAQDYPDTELVVVDQGRDPIADLLPPSAVYLQLADRRPIGELRNLACDAARGTIIVHWDDDDWMMPWRISRQVRALVESGADICGASRVFYRDRRDGAAWEYVYPAGQRPYVADCTLAYRKSLWSRRPFPVTGPDPELAFQWSDPATRFTVVDEPFMVAAIHSANTAPKHRNSPNWHRRDPADLPVLPSLDATSRHRKSD